MPTSRKSFRRSPRKGAAREPRVPLGASVPGPSPELTVVSKEAGALGFRSSRAGHIAAAPVSVSVSGGGVQAPPAKPSIKLLVVGHTVGRRWKAFDSPVVMDLLDLVQQRHGVEIESGVPFANTLTVIGSSCHSLRSALKDISVIKHRAGLRVQKQLFMVQATAEQQKEVSLAAKIDNPGWARFTCAAASEHGLLGPIVADFSTKLAELTPVIRAAPSNISLQIHLGRLVTSVEEKPGSSNAQPAVRMRGIVNGTNTNNAVVFDRTIGDGKFFDVCRRNATRSTDHFFPTSSIAESLDDIRLVKSLIIITAAFRVELKISPPRASSPVARLSCSRVFQLAGAEGRADLTVACPDQWLDWRLETFPEIKLEDIPRTVKDMMESISVTYPKLDEDFPIPAIPAPMFTTHRIKQVYGKTSWTVGCRGSRYLLELCRFHKFPRAGRVEGCNVSTGITISNASWEDALKAPVASGVCRDLDASWSQVFPPRRKRDGVTDLIKNMQSILLSCDAVLGTPPVGTTDNLSETNNATPAPASKVQSTAVLQNTQKGVPGESEDDLISFE
ncbi:hypothetical protein F503_06249 [Ophiostoma piceae UAMH 11346]|uniref:Uncharacterized protein n=1 Tax=Ophiostoma piceae (strain UAMH 11346) TaxID=1262450 RepID=S3CVD3_OPHP1|nr:hypothetical protein F503_06249 [Ophiostoma piceae UAMH 11346]